MGVDLSGLPDQVFRGVHMRDVWDILQPRMQGRVLRDPWLDAIERYYVAHRAEIMRRCRRRRRRIRALAAEG